MFGCSKRDGRTVTSNNAQDCAQRRMQRAERFLCGNVLERSLRDRLKLCVVRYRSGDVPQPMANCALLGDKHQQNENKLSQGASR